MSGLRQRVGASLRRLAGIATTGAVAVGSMLAAGAAQAGGLGVSPIRVELAPAQPTAVVTLENTGSTTMVLQLQVTRWTGTHDEDRYEPSDDLLATPPVMTVAPGRSQVVRIGLGAAAPAPAELAYRLFIEEVPPPPQHGQPSLQVALRVGVPIFVRPAQPVQPRLGWRIADLGDGGLVLEARNDGDAHTRLQAVRLRADAAADAPLAGASGYLLPGQRRRWALPAALAGGSARLHLSAATDRGTVDADLALPAR